MAFESCPPTVPILDFGPMLRFLRTQPRLRFVPARRSEELDGRGTKPLGGKSKRVVLPFFIADDSHFLDVLTLLRHEAHDADQPQVRILNIEDDVNRDGD